MLQAYLPICLVLKPWASNLDQKDNVFSMDMVLSYLCLRRPLSIDENLSRMACLSSWIILIRLWNTQSLKGSHRKKSGTLRLCDQDPQSGAVAIRALFQQNCLISSIIRPDGTRLFPIGALERLCIPEAYHDYLITLASHSWWSFSYWWGSMKTLLQQLPQASVCKNALI